MRSHGDLGYEVEFAHLYGFSSTQYRMVDGVGAPYIHHTLDHNAASEIYWACFFYSTPSEFVFREDTACSSQVVVDTNVPFKLTQIIKYIVSFSIITGVKYKKGSKQKGNKRGLKWLHVLPMLLMSTPPPREN